MAAPIRTPSSGRGRRGLRCLTPVWLQPLRARPVRTTKLRREKRQGKWTDRARPRWPWRRCASRSRAGIRRVYTKRLSATDISALASMKNVAKCDTWCELQNPVNHRVFERKLRPTPSGRGHVCLGVTHRRPPLPRLEVGARSGGGCWSPVCLGTRMAENRWTTVPNTASHGGRVTIDDRMPVLPWPCMTQDALRCSAI